MPKRTAIGKVKSDKMAKTRVVVIPRKVRHPVYGKFVRSKTTCYVHDENNESNFGDTVEIVESRPMSRTKRWSLIRVLERNQEVDLASLRAARKHGDDLESEVEELVSNEHDEI